MDRISPFESIRQEQDGREFWSARDLSRILGFKRWENFPIAIERAKEACRQSEYPVADHFRASTVSIFM